jgi:uncharacterized protein (DUF885 family)
MIIAALLAASAPAAAAPADDFAALLKEHWAWYLRNNPIQATTVGVRDYDDQLGEVTLESQDRQAQDAAAFLKRLDAIPDAGLSEADRTNKAILRRSLATEVEKNRFGQRMMLFSSIDSLHQVFPQLSTFVPLRTARDFESYLARLGQVPRLMDDQIAVTRKAVAGGYVQPCATLEGFEPTITGAVAADPEKSGFYAPFLARKPDAIPAAEWEGMQARVKRLIAERINPSYTRFATYFRTEYMPRCRRDIAVAAMPQGKDYYAFRVRELTTTDLTPDQIHDIGLAEVARIRGEMEAVAKKAGFASREAFIAELRTNPKYFAKTPEELMRVVALQAKVIDGKMPGIIGRVARLPYGLREIPAEIAPSQTTAYYNPGSPEAGIAGTYYVNTSKLDQRPLWEVPVLTIHEAVPGHHQQIALQQELELPEFRKYATSFTAFIEGWGLYSERLGIEMGVYDTPEKELGRLSYDMWRAARLVVDTGMHAKGWTRERAVQFMKDNTALTDANIDAEVNRYISWPAQALAYKIGQLKILELRQRAERELGAKFDLRGFHDAVLGQGAVPLELLEAQVSAWIAAQAKS